MVDGTGRLGVSFLLLYFAIGHVGFLQLHA